MATSVRRPVWMFFLIVPLVLLSGFGIPRIGFEDGLKSIFASDAVTFQQYVASSKSYAHSETDIAVLVTAANRFDTAELEQLQNFVLESQFLDGVEAVFSVFSLRRADPATNELEPLMPADLADGAAVQRALTLVNSQPGTGARLISSDLHQTVVVVSLAQAFSDMKGSSAVLAELQDLATQTQMESSLTIGITGLLSARDQIISGLKQDQLRINFLGGLAGFLISFVVFRSFWVTILNTFVPVAALVMCLGAFGWLGLSINALTNALPVLILVLASSDSIHMTYEIRRQMADGADIRTAVETSVRDVAGPCVLTSLTTILAFASLFYSDSPVVRVMAQAGVGGVFIAMVSVLFVHPMVFLLGARFAPLRRALPQPQKLDRPPVFSARLFEGFIKHKRAVSLTSIAACLIAVALFFPIKTNYRFMENIDAGLPIAKVMAEVERVAGPITSIDIPIEVRAGHAPLDPAVLDELAVLAGDLKSVDGVEGVISLDILARQIKAGTPAEMATSLEDILSQMPGRFKHRMISEDGTSLQVMLLVKDGGSEMVLSQVAAVTEVLQQAKLTILKPGVPTGFLVMSAKLSSAMIKQLTVSFLIAALICPVLIGLWFRRLDFGLAATIPNILPIVFVGAGLMVSGVGIQFTSALALTIAFGIALDDSIHVFNRLALQQKDPHKPLSGKAIKSAMVHIAPILVTTTIILAAGLAATQASTMPMVRLFGVLCVITFVLALLCDLFVLPALVAWFSSRKQVKQAP